MFLEEESTYNNQQCLTSCKTGHILNRTLLVGLFIQRRWQVRALEVVVGATGGFWQQFAGEIFHFLTYHRQVKISLTQISSETGENLTFSNLITLS